MKGVVSFVEQHPEWKTYSFQLSGDRTYYRAGKFFKYQVGDSIEFDTEVVGRNTKASKVRPYVAGPVSAGTPAAVVANNARGATSQQEYWAAREARDVETQKRIELQSCRNSALELVKLLLAETVGAVKLPGKQADKALAVEELVAHYTKVFLDENKTGVQPKDEVVPEAAEPAVASEPKQEEKNDDDNWN